MRCDDVRRVVYFFLDGSLSDEKRANLERHLSDCHDCEARVFIQRKLREFVRTRLDRVTAPDGLRARLARSLRATPAE